MQASLVIKESERDWTALEITWSPNATEWCELETSTPPKGFCGGMENVASLKFVPSPGPRPCGGWCLRLPLFRDACRLVLDVSSTSVASLLLGEGSIHCGNETVVALETKVALGSLLVLSRRFLDLLGIPGSTDGELPDILNPSTELLQTV